MPIEDDPSDLIKMSLGHTNGIRGVRQGHCGSGFFGPGLQLLTTYGMSVCCAVALAYQRPGGTMFGALIHYDLSRIEVDAAPGFSTPGVAEAFDRALVAAGLNKQTVLADCTTFLAFNPQLDCSTARAALTMLTGGGYPEPQQYAHHGIAALNDMGILYEEDS